MYTVGQKVEVYKQYPFAHWSSNYEYVRSDKNPITGAPNLILKITSGVSMGREVRYVPTYVRHYNGTKKTI